MIAKDFLFSIITRVFQKDTVIPCRFVIVVDVEFSSLSLVLVPLMTNASPSNINYGDVNSSGISLLNSSFEMTFTLSITNCMTFRN